MFAKQCYDSRSEHNRGPWCYLEENHPGDCYYVYDPESSSYRKELLEDWIIALRGSYSEEYTVLKISMAKESEIIKIIKEDDAYKNYKIVFIKPSSEIKEFKIETKTLFVEKK